ncbi:MAG: hypothetical protein HN720_15775 [Nitrospinaceae bacterium]|nr:hypothetical protein [Nitrospinaceae bacterium]
MSLARGRSCLRRGSHIFANTVHRTEVLGVAAARLCVKDTSRDRAGRVVGEGSA